MSLSEPLTSVDVDADSSYAKMGNGGEKHDTFSAPSTPSTSTAVSTLRAHRIAIAVLSVLFLTAVIFAIIFASRSPATDTVLTPAPTSTGSAYVPVETEALREIGRDMDYSRDLTANPCEHWYQYACGGWTAKQPQGNFTSITKGFTLARLDNVQYVRQILMEDWPIITPLFQSCMNNEAIEAAGVQPLQGLLDLFNPNSSWITAASDVFFQLGRLRTSQRLTALVSATQTANQTAPTQPLLNLGFGGLTVTAMNGQVWPSYIGARNTTARMVQGIAEVLQAIGDPAPWAWAWARAVVDFETAMVNITARAQINSQGPMNFEQELAEERRLAAYNGMYSFEAAQALAPSLPLMSFLMGTGIPDVLKRAGTPPMAFIADADAFPLMADLISRTPVATLLAYARWRVVNVSMPYLAWSTRQVHHDYFGDDEMTLALPNDYTYCSGQVVSTLADDLFGRYFVSLRLQPEKARVAHNLMTWVRQAFERNLPSVSWMDDDTRKVALEKANAMIELVGGPEDGNWGDYSQVTIKRDTWYNNWVQMQGMRANDEWVQLTRPISRARFSMNPSLVNAQYSSRANAMTFPAAILQAPFFDFESDTSAYSLHPARARHHRLLHRCAVHDRLPHL